MVGVKGGGIITFDTVTFAVRRVISLHCEGNTDCNSIIKYFIAISNGTDLHHIKFATFALLLYLW